MPGNPLQFDLNVGDVLVHSKFKGQGFISTTDKLKKCVSSIVKIFGDKAQRGTAELISARSTDSVKSANNPVGEVATKTAN